MLSKWQSWALVLLIGTATGFAYGWAAGALVLLASAVSALGIISAVARGSDV